MNDTTFKNSSALDSKSSAIKGLDDCLELKKIYEIIADQNPLQKKRITAFLQDQGEEYWEFAEGLSNILNHGFLSSDDERQLAAKSYTKMCNDFLAEQIRFRKTGVYRINDASIANTEVYSDITVMRYYMVGLLLSYIFWPNHYKLFRFFLNNLPQKRIESYLEVGVGHGLFTSNMLTRYPNITPTIVDISETSIRTAKDVLSTFNIDYSEIDFILGDYLTVPIETSGFDFIIMGEVLEHVNDAPGFMERTKKLLHPNGTIYLSTCANSPALDHVYHFHSANEIRELLERTGFNIITDLALPAENVPEERWQEELVTINYCALLEHR